MEESIVYLEKLRQRAMLRLIITILLSFTLTILCLTLFSSWIKQSFGLFLFILMVAGISYLLAHITGFIKLYNSFKTQYKSSFVEKPFGAAFSNVIYDGAMGLEESVIKETGIMRLGNRYYSNDYVQGEYKDVQFKRSDIKIQYHHHSGKTSYTVTYLHGRWLIFDFNKNFHSDLQLVGNDFPCPQKNNSIFTEENDRRHRVKMEDIEFNEMYRVYCQDDHEAYYILTPQFMSVLKELYQSMDGALMLGFIDNQLHIAIHNEKDAMEPSIFDEIDLSTVKEEVQKEIKVIIDIIDSLGLDEDIYKT